jgi:hypothetical protein
MDPAMAKTSIPLTAERLKQLVHSDPESGIFTAACDRESSSIKAGQRLGWINGKGYYHIMLDRRSYRANRLAWLYMTGGWPPHQVDHLNHDKADDRWANLRAATNQQNQRNITMSKANTSGIRGVGWHKRIEKWQASIRVDGRLLSLGYFESLDEAAQVRRDAELRHFGDFAPSPAA